MTAAGPARPHEARQAWLENPTIAARYQARAAVHGRPWPQWVQQHLGRVPVRSLELGCAAGERSFQFFERGWVGAIDGITRSEDALLAAEEGRARCRAPGQFWCADLGAAALPAGRYDLVFAVHSVHDIAGLEGLFAQVHRSLTPEGLFVVESYVGPSRFQWTREQLALVGLAAGWLPERLRRYRSGVLKVAEGTSPPSDVAHAAPLATVRSAEIVPAFSRVFRMVERRSLGGTLQHPLYNGIIQNFADDDPEALAWLARIGQLEETLIDAGLLASDFMLVVGGRRA